MNSTILSLVISLVFLIIFLFFGLWMLWKILQKNQQESLQLLQTNERLMSKMVGVLAVKDPLAFQQIQAMEYSTLQSVEYDTVSQDDLNQALREAERNGAVFDPSSLEDDIYDADSIAKILGQSDGSEPTFRS